MGMAQSSGGAMMPRERYETMRRQSAPAVTDSATGGARFISESGSGHVWRAECTEGEEIAVKK
jgi:hypothetical protein